MKKILMAIFGLLFFAGSAFATPVLQLDVMNGVYDNADETIYATSDSFQLVALLNDSSLLSDTFYISAALRPQKSVGGNYGSFSFAGNTVNVTADMIYGTPPNDISDDLPSHGIFETFYSEHEFKFSGSNTAIEYNSQDSPGGFVPDINGTLYYALFNIDTSFLADGYTIHFDLYNIAYKEGDLVLGKFAPFSHDANSTSIPEPVSLILLGLGLIGLAGIKRKIS